MHNEFYSLCNLHIKDTEEKSKSGDTFKIRGVNSQDIDSFIVDFLKKFGINVDILYTSNVSIQNFALSNEKIILWDLSFWDLYDKYLDFVFFIDYYNNIENGNDKDIEKDYCRLVMEGTLYDYLALKFMSEAELSYCFALLYNANRIDMVHRVTDDVIREHYEFKRAQMFMAKLWGALHECGHLKMFNAFGNMDDFKGRCLENLRRIVKEPNTLEFYSYDPGLVNGVKDKVKKMAYDDNDDLLDEIFSDAIALDMLEVVIDNGQFFYPQMSKEEFAHLFISMQEIFTNFNTILFDLYVAWDTSLKLMKGTITERIYHDIFHKRDVDSVIRGMIFPCILMVQADRVADGKFVLDRYTKQRFSPKLNMRKEMLDLFDLAYNNTIKEVVFAAVNRGFHNGKMSIEEARDVLIGWKPLDTFFGAKPDDLFLKEGEDVDGKDSFYMFIRRYGFH
uniref:hypothetical protein n=1 Tax=Agathobacter sp. TaxID=2021311 RepID=UPI00405659E3